MYANNVKLFRYRRLLSLLCLCSLILLTPGCSSTRLAYGFFDNLLRSYISDYVPVDRQQRRLLREAVDDFHHWHQCHELPLYSDVLVRFSTDLNQPLSIEQMQTYLDEFDQALMRTMEHVHPWAVTLLSELSAEQAEELRDNLAAEHQKTADEYQSLSAEERHDERVEAMTDGLKRWLGRLNDGQHQQIAEWSQIVRDVHGHFQHSGAEWQHQFYQLLQQNSLAQPASETPDPIFAMSLYQLLVHADQYWSDQHQQDMDYNKQVTLATLSDIFNGMDDRQRRRMQKKLAGYAEDFDYLASKDRCQTDQQRWAATAPQ